MSSALPSVEGTDNGRPGVHLSRSRHASLRKRRREELVANGGALTPPLILGHEWSFR